MKTKLTLAVALVTALTGVGLAETPAKHMHPSTEAPMSKMSSVDARQPLFMLPMMADHQKQNMRDHLAAVNEIVAALAKNDFAAVGESAKRLGTSPAMQQMCTHMGAATPGFSERALAFHQTADTIIPAAKTKNAPKVLTALNKTMDTCVSCHASFRQEVVDQARWDELTKLQP